MNRRYLLLIIMMALTGCNFDQIDHHYNDYNAIVNEGYNKKGWLPENLTMPSTTDLYSRTDVDVNSFLIRFSVSQNDLNQIKDQLEGEGQEFTAPHRLKIPNWWSSTDGLQKYKYTNESNIWWFAIDSENCIIYCWGDH